jgi:hypothetical protein
MDPVEPKQAGQQRRRQRGRGSQGTTHSASHVDAMCHPRLSPLNAQSIHCPLTPFVVQVVLFSSLKSCMHARRATAGASGSRGARAGFAHFAARRSALKTSGAISQLTILSWLGAPSAVE